MHDCTNSVGCSGVETEREASHCENKVSDSLTSQWQQQLKQKHQHHQQQQQQTQLQHQQSQHQQTCSSIAANNVVPAITLASLSSPTSRQHTPRTPAIQWKQPTSLSARNKINTPPLPPFHTRTFCESPSTQDEHSTSISTSSILSQSTSFPSNTPTPIPVTTSFCIPSHASLFRVMDTIDFPKASDVMFVCRNMSDKMSQVEQRKLIPLLKEFCTSMEINQHLTTTHSSPIESLTTSPQVSTPSMSRTTSHSPLLHPFSKRHHSYDAKTKIYTIERHKTFTSDTDKKH